MNNIDHEYTDNIVCPYCGYEDIDSWEYSDNDDTIDCIECGKVFTYTRIVDVTYCTHKESEVNK